jgi:hypothetical protein
MDPVTQATALVRFLLDRGPSSAELEKFEAFGFDYHTFLIQLLCSDEAAERYGNIAQHLIEYVRLDMTRDAQPHRIAHDLALSKEELEKLQARLDRLNGQMIELLKHEDRIAALFEAIGGIQADFNALRGRLEQIETSMLQSVGADDDY